MNSPSQADAAASVAMKEAVMRRAASVTVYPPHVSRTSSRNRGTRALAPVSNQNIRKEDDGERLLVESNGMPLPHFQGIARRLPL